MLTVMMIVMVTIVNNLYSPCRNEIQFVPTAFGVGGWMGGRVRVGEEKLNPVSFSSIEAD